MRHTEKWYQRRLAKYFTEHYSKYEDTAEYYADPAPNIWHFMILELRLRVMLVCDDSGQVREKRVEI